MAARLMTIERFPPAGRGTAIADTKRNGHWRGSCAAQRAARLRIKLGNDGPGLSQPPLESIQKVLEGLTDYLLP
jgi:hypothetical protein